MSNNDIRLEEEYSKCRAKNPDQIIESAFNWNFSCDVGLLKFMEQFAMDTVTKCNDINNRIAKLSESVTDTQSYLNRVSGQFQQLFDTNVVEHRICREPMHIDEKEPDLEPSERVQVNKLPKDKNIEDLTPNEFMGTCIDLIDEYYEQVPFPKCDDDSIEMDDGDDSNNFVLRPINKFIKKRLPALAGSETWLNKWHLGTESTSESENDDTNDMNSEITSIRSKSSSNKCGTEDGTSENCNSIGVLSANDIITEGPATSTVLDKPEEPALSFLQELQTKLTLRPTAKQFTPIFSEEPPSAHSDEFIPKPKSPKCFIGSKSNLFNDEPPPQSPKSVSSTSSTPESIQKRFNSDFLKSLEFNLQKHVISDSLPVTSAPQTIFMEIEDEPKLLTSLTKDRVRNAGRRRPSSRKARQELLTRSLVFDNVDKSLENIPKSKTIEDMSESKNENTTTSDLSVNELFSSIETSRKSRNDFDEIFRSVDRKFSALFSSSKSNDDDFEDLFRSSTITKKSMKPETEQEMEKDEDKDSFEDPLGLFK